MLIPLPASQNERFIASANNTTSAPHVPRIHTHELTDCVWKWDEPLRLLSITSTEDLSVTLSLESLRAFSSQLRKVDPLRLQLLVSALDDVSRELDLWSGSAPWPLALRDAIGVLLLYVVAAKSSSAKHVALTEAAMRVIPRMPADAPSGAWRTAFQRHLPYAHRSGVLAAATEAEESMPMRELVWWTAKCRVELAVQWVEEHRIDEADALRELWDSAADYIRLLQNEPCRRAMESFFTAMGTSSELEVLRAHDAREEHASVDDLVRADLTTWLLRRYSLFQTVRLLVRTLQPRETAGAVLALLLTSAAAAFFLRQTLPRAQVALQILAFVVVVFLAPRLFSLMLPRAMFGTLLAWIMVVLAQTASLLPLLPGDKGQQFIYDASHAWLREVIVPGDTIVNWIAALMDGNLLARTPALLDFAAIVAICIAVATVFVMVEVSNRLSTRIFGRSLYCVLVMLLGSLFWGAMLAPALRYIVVREPFGSSCLCLFPAWFLGSVCAVAFGILVQLMWDDRAISDSVGMAGERPAS
jgi:hypothetical protein